MGWKGGIFIELEAFYLGQSGDKYPWEWEDGERGVQKKRKSLGWSVCLHISSAHFAAMFFFYSSSSFAASGTAKSALCLMAGLVGVWDTLLAASVFFSVLYKTDDSDAGKFQGPEKWVGSIKFGGPGRSWVRSGCTLCWGGRLWTQPSGRRLCAF
ncbi:hypothetical protein QBC40DRAFT_100310 [Triangularia verruculosa]|uniref:Uncharacterized protein n=1 Tax=Triangularia verruculosa TaxID=2587418 RepID=A0AAN6XFU5_9PEZI|nr:hypothetical protein QBC40DRAFT_100310 [Triangularia verruculosa]